MSKSKEYNVSFRCYFPGADNKTQHYMTMPLKDIAKWIEAYSFTHPNLQSIRTMPTTAAKQTKLKR